MTLLFWLGVSLLTQAVVSTTTGAGVVVAVGAGVLVVAGVFVGACVAGMASGATVAIAPRYTDVAARLFERIEVQR
jgi:hypothetical protein